MHTIFPTLPPTAEYELTRPGRKPKSVIHAMAGFGVAAQKSGRLPGIRNR